MLAWLRRQADSLGLRDWRIRVSPFDAVKGSDASSFVKDEGDETVIAVGREFLRDDPVEQRATLVHELLHCHFQPLTRLAETLVEAELGKRTEAVIDAAVANLEERTIERLAHPLAMFLEPFEMPA